MDKLEKKAAIKQFNLSIIVLILLILISLLPLSIFFLFTQKEVVSELKTLEEEQQLNHMEDELEALKSKIDSYQNMLDFVSELPAVFEILDKGKKLSGAISQETAYDRYIGVLSRAFKKNNDVFSIHILDLNRNVRFSLTKNPETTQYYRVFGSNPSFDQDLLHKTFQMNEKGFVMSPLLLSKENLSEDGYPPKIFLRIFTPIFLKKEKIGVFCSDIDIGILTQSFPEINWVLNNGSYLFHARSGENAFSNFPGLRDIFLADKAGVWRNDHATMAWMPVLKGKNVSLALWAGKEIALTAVQSARTKMLMDVLIVFLILLTILLLILFWISKYTKRVSAQFLDDLRQSIFHHHNAFQDSKTRVREFSEFSQNIAYILEQNTNLEKQRQKTLDEVKTLRGIFPICSYCKNIRNDQGYYEQIEDYIHKHSGVDFSHTICPKCMKELYPQEYETITNEQK